jgi:hypothetical protein
MVIDNRGGSGGVIAADIAAHSVPDGYTLFLGGSASHGITPHLYRKLPYDPVRDFASVSLIGEAPYFLIVNPAVAATTVKELIALAQAKPGQLNYGSAASNGRAVSQHGEYQHRARSVQRRRARAYRSARGPTAAYVRAGGARAAADARRPPARARCVQ